jgi:branched-subunit amino acid transport protein AzlD
MGILRALTVVRRTLVQWIGAIVWLTLASAVWALCGVTVVLLPFGTVGLFVVAHYVVYDQRVTPYAVLATIRSYAWLTVQWTVVNAAVLGVLYVALIDDSTAGKVPSGVQALLAIFGTVWLATQIVFWPLVFEQTDKRLLPTLRSGIGLLLATLDFTVLVGTAIVALLLLIASTLPYGLLLAGPAALLCTNAVRDRLIAFGATPHANRIGMRSNQKRPGDEAGAS